MANRAELNRRFNRALRTGNDLAVCAAETFEGEVREMAVRKIVAAIASLMEAHKLLLDSDSELEYHNDSSRPPTAFMRSISDLEVEANQLVEEGRTREGIDCLKRALSLEPPPLDFEIISKRIQQLSSSEK